MWQKTCNATTKLGFRDRKLAAQAASKEVLSKKAGGLTPNEMHERPDQDDDDFEVV